MEYIRDLTTYESSSRCVVTLGKFDGVHRGHRKLLARVRALAEQRGWKSCAFTFSVSPQVFMGAHSQKMLMTNAERKDILRELGIELLVECPFTPAVRNMEAEDFVTEILLGRLHAAAVVVGTDFHFGKNRSGTPEFLCEMGRKYNFEVDVLPKEMDGSREISSTYIREELSRGNMEKVNELLGYRWFVSGTIVHGRHMGHKLGFPTINIIPDPSKMVPPNGVYLSTTFVAGRWYQGISDIGVKPTVNGDGLGLETYLFDCSYDLYGQAARVEFLKRTREEIRFASVEELKKQLDRDISDADIWFSAHMPRIS